MAMCKPYNYIDTLLSSFDTLIDQLFEYKNSYDSVFDAIIKEGYRFSIKAKIINNDMAELFKTCLLTPLQIKSMTTMRGLDSNFIAISIDLTIYTEHLNYERPLYNKQAVFIQCKDAGLRQISEAFHSGMCIIDNYGKVLTNAFNGNLVIRHLSGLKLNELDEDSTIDFRTYCTLETNDTNRSTIDEDKAIDRLQEYIESLKTQNITFEVTTHGLKASNRTTRVCETFKLDLVKRYMDEQHFAAIVIDNNNVLVDGDYYSMLTYIDYVGDTAKVGLLHFTHILENYQDPLANFSMLSLNHRINVPSAYSASFILTKEQFLDAMTHINAMDNEEVDNDIPITTNIDFYPEVNAIGVTHKFPDDLGLDCNKVAKSHDDSTKEMLEHFSKPVVVPYTSCTNLYIDNETTRLSISNTPRVLDSIANNILIKLKDEFILDGKLKLSALSKWCKFILLNVSYVICLFALYYSLAMSMKQSSFEDNIVSMITAIVIVLYVLWSKLVIKD
jgi:hypothetical protein